LLLEATFEAELRKMHPGQIEVNEITGYWTFLLSVSYFCL